MLIKVNFPETSLVGFVRDPLHSLLIYRVLIFVDSDINGDTLETAFVINDYSLDWDVDVGPGWFFTLSYEPR